MRVRHDRRTPEQERQRQQTPERQKLVREVSRRMREKYPEKRRARHAVSNALQAGKITRQPCEVCGADKSEAHHDDYSQPLKVRWLCRPHHRAYDKRHE